MTNKVVGIRFKKAGKIYYFDPLDNDLVQYDHVIVETIQGLEYGEVAIGPREIDRKTFKNQIKPVLRKATKEDDAEYVVVKRKEKEAGRIFSEKVKQSHLDMKLVNVEYTFDMKKAIFYFIADGRVDFRDLVKDLASTFKVRIELRQIGVRDEVRNFNTLGVCGRDTCCSRWLGDFVPVSIRMAKEQGMALNSTKISGVCGRLLCCLTYEHDFYKTVIKKMPKVGQTVNTPDGEGTVFRLSALKENVIVRIEKENGDAEIKTYSLDEITNINGKGYGKVFSESEDDLFDLDSDLMALEDEPGAKNIAVSSKRNKKQRNNGKIQNEAGHKQSYDNGNGSDRRSKNKKTQQKKQENADGKSGQGQQNASDNQDHSGSKNGRHRKHRRRNKGNK